MRRRDNRRLLQSASLTDLRHSASRSQWAARFKLPKREPLGFKNHLNSPPSAATYGQRKRSNGHVHFFPFSVLTVTFAPLERQTIVPHSSVR